MDLEWTLADRLAKSRRVAGLSVQDMAERLDVHRNTVAGWESGRHVPRRRDVVAWSMATGVPLTWLQPQQRAASVTSKNPTEEQVAA